MRKYRNFANSPPSEDLFTDFKEMRVYGGGFLKSMELVDKDLRSCKPYTSFLKDLRMAEFLEKNPDNNPDAVLEEDEDEEDSYGQLVFDE